MRRPRLQAAVDTRTHNDVHRPYLLSIDVLRPSMPRPRCTLLRTRAVLICFHLLWVLLFALPHVAESRINSSRHYRRVLSLTAAKCNVDDVLT
jgi:hypothetical protein